MARNVAGLLRSENNLKLTASKELGTQSYNCKELNSATISYLGRGAELQMRT